MRSLLVLVGPDAERAEHADMTRRLRAAVPDMVPLVPVEDVVTRAQLVARASHAATQGDLVVVVGYTNAVESSKVLLSGHIVALPDLPGQGGSPFTSAVQTLAEACRSASYVIARNDAERVLLERHVPGLAGKVLLLDSCGGQIESMWRDPGRNPSATLDRRVCLVGEDLRHAAIPSRALLGVAGVGVETYAWPLGATKPPRGVARALTSADTVFCDWAGRHSVWAADNLHAVQRLVVRLHGYELNSSWIHRLDIDAVDAVVVVSEHWRRRVVESLGWPQEKVLTIPNSVDAADLARPKHPQARYHLAMLGWVPMLKRPDLAVELLSRLLDRDSRYVLHLRGDAPWDLKWLWEHRLRERLAYESLLRVVGADERLVRALRIEPFGADIADWFRGIGWMLSLSDTESFHLAAVEGMAAGSVPVARTREGVADVLGTDFLVHDIESAVQRIAGVDDEEWQVLSAHARHWASQYDVGRTREVWREVLLGA